MIDSETDAILRQLRGYIRVLRDPPREDPERSLDEQKAAIEARILMANLFASEFTRLDKMLCDGASAPEQWDRKMRNTYRTRRYNRHGFQFLYPPGFQKAGCQMGADPWPCKWLNSSEALSVCQRCHTIRIKLK